MASIMSGFIPTGSVPLALISAIILIAFGRYVIYPAFFSPLSQIPAAHPLASWTSLWILRRRLNGNEIPTLYKAHQEQGPIVRVGPNEISVNNFNDGIKPIYSGNYDKHHWFSNVFANYRIDNTFTLQDGKAHAERKRLFTNLYSKSQVQNSPEIKEITEELIVNRVMPIFQKAALGGKPVEFFHLAAAIGMDFITSYLFGLNAGTDFIRDEQYRNHWLQKYDTTKPYLSLVAELIFPVVLLKMIGISAMPQHVFDTIDSMNEWNLKMCKAAQEACESGNKAGTTRAVVYEQMTEGLAKVDQSSLKNPKEMMIASEMLDNIFAGHETAQITLVYMLYEVSQRPKLQEKLRDELRTLSPRFDYPASKGSNLPNPRALDALPLLDAVLQETLRRWPPAQGSQPRVTPRSGAKIGPYTVPGGVRISCNQYCLHRNEEVFPDPESWKPERWLDASAAQKAEMNRWFFAFGTGPRMCLGVHYATQEIKYLAAAIWTNYETSVHSHGDMTATDGFAGAPRGGSLQINFSRVD